MLAALIVAILGTIVALSFSLVAVPLVEGMVGFRLPDPGLIPVVSIALGVNLLGAFIARALAPRPDASRYVVGTCLIVALIACVPIVVAEPLPGLIWVSVPRYLLIGAVGAVLLPRVLLTRDED